MWVGSMGYCCPCISATAVAALSGIVCHGLRRCQSSLRRVNLNGPQLRQCKLLFVRNTRCSSVVYRTLHRCWKRVDRRFFMRQEPSQQLGLPGARRPIEPGARPRTEKTARLCRFAAPSANNSPAYTENVCQRCQPVDIVSVFKQAYNP